MRRILTLTMLAVLSLMLVVTIPAIADNKTDKDKPDHCKEASEKVKEAGNEFGHGNFGTATEKLGEAAGAGYECLKEKIKGKKKNK